MRSLECIILGALAALAVASCGVLPTSLEVGSVELDSVSMKGLRGAGATIVVEVNNPSKEVALSSIAGSLKRGDGVFASFKAEDFTITGGASGIYRIPVEITLDKSQGLIAAAAYISVRDFSDLSIEASCDFSMGGKRPRHVLCKEMPVTKALEVKSGRDLLRYIRIKR